MITTPDQQGADDLTAFNEWEDGAGEECATASGVWFAALAYERARLRTRARRMALKEADELEKDKAQRWAWEATQDHLANIYKLYGRTPPQREPFPLDIKLTP